MLASFEGRNLQSWGAYERSGQASKGEIRASVEQSLELCRLGPAWWPGGEGGRTTPQKALPAGWDSEPHF